MMGARCFGLMMKPVLLSALFLPSLALAQDMVFDHGPTEACLAAAISDSAACIGHAADACMLEN